MFWHIQMVLYEVMFINNEMLLITCGSDTNKYWSVTFLFHKSHLVMEQYHNFRRMMTVWICLSMILLVMKKKKTKRNHQWRSDLDLCPGRLQLALVLDRQARRDPDQTGGPERAAILILGQGRGQGNFSCGTGFRSNPKSRLGCNK